MPNGTRHVPGLVGTWEERREAHQRKVSESIIDECAEEMVDRLARIYDKAIDVIDQTITEFREDPGATEKKRIGESGSRCTSCG